MNIQIRIATWLAIFLFGSPVAVSGQERDRSASPKFELHAAMEKIGHPVALDNLRADGVLHYRISWPAPENKTGTQTGIHKTTELSVLDSSIRSREKLPRQRSSELSKDQLVTIALDQQGIVRFWRIVSDPRLIRGEFPDRDGNLVHRSFYRSDVILDVLVPSTISATQLKILKPHWDSTGALQLLPVHTIQLPAVAPR